MQGLSDNRSPRHLCLQLHLPKQEAQRSLELQAELHSARALLRQLRDNPILAEQLGL